LHPSIEQLPSALHNFTEKMPEMGKSKLPTVQGSDGNNEERARTKDMLAFLQTKSQSYALKKYHCQ